MYLYINKSACAQIVSDCKTSLQGVRFFHKNLNTCLVFFSIPLKKYFENESGFTLQFLLYVWHSLAVYFVWYIWQVISLMFQACSLYLSRVLVLYCPYQFFYIFLHPLSSFLFSFFLSLYSTLQPFRFFSFCILNYFFAITFFFIINLVFSYTIF